MFSVEEPAVMERGGNPFTSSSEENTPRNSVDSAVPAPAGKLFENVTSAIESHL